MKKEYSAPVIEKIEFDYREQIVTSDKCQVTMNRTEYSACGTGIPLYNNAY